MCRNIRTLHNFEPPATPEEVSAAALQYVRKISGTTKPSQANQAAFDRLLLLSGQGAGGAAEVWADATAPARLVDLGGAVVAEVPAGSLADEGPALYHRGFNLSDDLFMYFKRPVEGLEPGRRYEVTFSLEFASEAGQDCDIGTATSVFLKTGASTEEPVRVIGDDGWVRLSVDKGEQANEGPNALILGDMRNGVPGCGPEVPWALRTYESANRSLRVPADDEGRLWLFFGSESAFEVAHELFIERGYAGTAMTAIADRADVADHLRRLRHHVLVEYVDENV